MVAHAPPVSTTDTSAALRALATCNATCASRVLGPIVTVAYRRGAAGGGVVRYESATRTPAPTSGAGTVAVRRARNTGDSDGTGECGPRIGRLPVHPAPVRAEPFARH